MRALDCFSGVGFQTSVVFKQTTHQGSLRECKLINDPQVVFLDEPMSGLDPVGRREVRDLIAGLRQEGMTVFMCSHILSDIEVLCDQVAILKRGQLAHLGNPTNCVSAPAIGITSRL